MAHWGRGPDRGRLRRLRRPPRALGAGHRPKVRKARTRRAAISGRTPGGLGGATLLLRLVAADTGSRAPLRRRGSLPGVKGAHERVDLLEAEHERDFAHPEIRVRQESSG